MDTRTVQDDSPHLKAADLMSQIHKVIIKDAGAETLISFKTGQDEQKVVVYFENRKKDLPLNSTNLDWMNTTFGFETDMWRGKEIELFTIRTNFEGKDGIRIQLPRTTAVPPLPGATPLTGAVPAQQPAIPPSGTFAGGAPAAAPAPVVAPAAQQQPPNEEPPF